MASEVGICNMALSELGIAKFISSVNPSDGSAEGNACAVHYETARDQALVEIGPRWATQRKFLSPVGTKLVTNWGYVYGYPSDCLNVQGIALPGMRLPRLENSIPYEVANYNGSQVILCDIPDAEVIYTSRVTNTGLYDAQFTFALANLLGSRIAMPLAHGDLANSLLQAYYALAAQAGTKSQNEANPGEQPMGSIEASRS